MIEKAKQNFFTYFIIEVYFTIQLLICLIQIFFLQFLNTNNGPNAFNSPNGGHTAVVSNRNVNLYLIILFFFFLAFFPAIQGLLLQSLTSTSLCNIMLPWVVSFLNVSLYFIKIIFFQVEDNLNMYIGLLGVFSFDILFSGLD